MTDFKPDWAEEIAENIADSFGIPFVSFPGTIRAALRKAKADGMREAISLQFGELQHTAISSMYQAILTRADKIERGEA